MSKETCIIKEHVPAKLKLNFGLGALGNFLLSALVFANLSFFYVEKMGADPGLIGIAWLIFGIWNTINDPIVSYFIDNTRTKIGRRIPYIRYGSFLYGISFILCWFPFASYGDTWGLFFNFLLALFFLDTMFSIVGCCYFALPNEIAVTAEGRASLSVYNSLFYISGVIISFLIPIFLLTGQEGGVHPLFYPVMITIGIVSTLLLFITSFGIKENMFAQMQEQEGFIEGLKNTLKNKPFWIFMLPAFCIALLVPILQIGLLYYIDYIIVQQDITFMFIGIGIGAIIGLGLTLTKVDDWGPKIVMMVTLFLGALGFTILFFLGRNVIAAAFPAVLIGVGLAGSLITNPVIMGDLIDNDELITGKRREAIYGGVNALIVKYPISIANWLFLLVIVGFGFVPPQLVDGVNIKQPQSELAIYGIMFAFCIIPAIFLWLSTIAMKRYPLHGPEWKEKKAYIMELHEEKQEKWVKKCADEGLIDVKKKDLP